ncbi:MAG TPA: hypothetical protein VFV63_02180 [Ilumatobacteraceae bacterium]|nr:hypothetical protein [Ilumatobacteraceae bacterium]
MPIATPDAAATATSAPPDLVAGVDVVRDASAEVVERQPGVDLVRSVPVLVEEVAAEDPRELDAVATRPRLRPCRGIGGQGDDGVVPDRVVGPELDGGLFAGVGDEIPRVGLAHVDVDPDARRTQLTADLLDRVQVDVDEAPGLGLAVDGGHGGTERQRRNGAERGPPPAGVLGDGHGGFSLMPRPHPDGGDVADLA